MKKVLDIQIHPQSEEECGTSALKDVMVFFGTDEKLDVLVDECSKESMKFRDWDYRIALAALKRNFHCEITTLVTSVFDPSWFKLSKKELIKRMSDQLLVLQDVKDGKRDVPDEYEYEHYIDGDILELEAAQEFLQHGGKILFEPTTVQLIQNYLKRDIPIIAGVNAALLHRIPRKVGFKDDEFTGSVWSHMLIISGFDEDKFHIHDPGVWYDAKQQYWIQKDWLVESITRRDQNIIAVYK